VIRIALAQVNPTIGDLDGNAGIVAGGIHDAKAAGADIVAFPEMVITGYPPDDLLLKKSFLRDSRQALESLAPLCGGITAVVGCVHEEGGHLYSAAALVVGGQVRGIYKKHHLPNYGVFDEKRFFTSGDEILLGRLGGSLIGLTVCEDLWLEEGPHVACAAAGASLVININASPYHEGKGRVRYELLSNRARRNRIAISYVNCVGGGDEIIFDGQSFSIAADGTLIARAAQFEEELLVFDFDPEGVGEPEPPVDYIGEPVTVVDLGQPSTKPSYTEATIAPEMTEEHEVYSALRLGVRDYMGKNGFKQALIGISGGIDSALTATIACDAVGGENVLGITNPSEFTSSQSTQDAKQLAHNLGFELVSLPIGPSHEAMRRTLTVQFPGADEGVTDQNLQARVRGMLWMAVSNLTGRIVLSTGNKSEMAVGYATLYGDMAGGFAVLKDVPKTLVYRLAVWRNSFGEVIPQSIIERLPTAELAHGQLDTDALPPYELLDPILKAYVEQDLCVDEIAALGYDRELVKKVVTMVDRAEYKRRQAPPGIKITPRAFGRERRLPITNRYRQR
jgi:NAD+ synthase (glutamine-hydrolysing)